MIGRRSIRKKLLAMVMSITLAALAVSLGTVIVYDLRGYHRTLVDDLSAQAELLGHMSSAALTFDDMRLARDNLALLRLRPSVRAGAVYDASGALFASYVAPGEAGTFPQRPEAAGPPRVQGNDLFLFRKVVVDGEEIGTVYLRARHGLLARTADYLAIGAGVLLLAMGTAWLLMRRLQHVVTAPILAITGIAREVVATRDYSRRAPRISSDETAGLVDSFNAMLTEIEQRTRELEDSNREIAREAEQRAEAQQEVMRLNQQLEGRVQERTMQLELANAELGLAIEEARSANNAKSAFLSSMSHELRTPLNAILGFAQVLTSDAMPSTLEQKKEFAQHIFKSGRHLLALINEVLDLARIESGAVALSMEAVALGDVLEECRPMLDQLAAARGVRVLFPQACGLLVQADVTRLKQVLLNLLSNAVKYNREGGAVVIDCAVGDTGRVRLSVQDTGLGLRPDQLAALFQPFNRLGQENGKQEGTGIGLVVTRRLVELMGGTIGVSSSPGVGTLFWIELDAVAQSAAHPARGAPALALAKATPAAGVPHLLLYVEDNPASLGLVQEIVRFRADLRLLAASDGQVGLSLARAHLPHIVLMDLNLPGLDGFALLRELRRDARTAGIPAIALTANAMACEVERGLEAGFFRYLTKPVELGSFNEAIDAALAQLAARADAAHRKAS